MVMLSSENHVLVVDDVEAIRSFMQIVLGRAGFRNVDCVCGGQEVMHKIDHQHYHLVLLDINLPGSNGMSVLRRIREKSPHTQVVMCSSNTSQHIKLEAQRAGAIGFLEKPIIIKDFLTLLEHLRLGEVV
ncbi:response regulator [Alteromonas sp. a30]|uniref:response regulator n=1 Tax=Alteromonas sp. a30 TaxID=2730917 RepID=UPI00227FFDA8|nr:response regulator [Alteromonas sp. a30]MCY7295999.1 response regulator [Alteromonas sp. a30]